MEYHGLALAEIEANVDAVVSVILQHQSRRVLERQHAARTIHKRFAQTVDTFFAESTWLVVSPRCFYGAFVMQMSTMIRGGGTLRFWIAHECTY